MSARYEVGAADDTLAYIVRPDSAEAGNLELKNGKYALVIADPGPSAYAVTGTPDELRNFMTRLSRTLRGLPE